MARFLKNIITKAIFMKNPPYIQEINVQDFVGFDWGSEEANMEHHGQPTPPKYILEDVNTPVSILFTSHY